MRQAFFLCALVSLSSAASLPSGNGSSTTVSEVASDHYATNRSVILTSTAPSGASSSIVSSPQTPPAPRNSQVDTEKTPNPGKVGNAPNRPIKQDITFHDWFSQLSLWAQIPLAVVIFFVILFLLIIIFDIILFWCACCCACGIACCVPDDYVRI